TTCPYRRAATRSPHAGPDVSCGTGGLRTGGRRAPSGRGVGVAGYPRGVIDLRVLRDTPDVVRESQTRRGEDPSLVDAVLDLDRRRRAALSSFEPLRAEQQSLGKEVSRATGDQKAELLARTRELAGKVKAAQGEADTLVAALDVALTRLGNLVADGVPAG